MRSLLLAKGGLNKLRAHQKELKQVDFEDSLKSIPPGEWCVLHHPTQPVEYISFINSLIDEKFACVQIVCEVIRQVFCRWYIGYDELSLSNAVADPVHPHVDSFSFLLN